jgi:predicted PurR-regulated permease PerM
MTNTQHHFFVGLLLVVIVLTIVIFLPFLTPIVLAAALAVIFGPIHRSIVRTFFKNKERSGLAALVTLIIVAVVIMIPALLLAGRIYTEVQNLYAYLIDEGSRSSIINTLNSWSDVLTIRLFNLYPGYNFDTFNITAVLKRALEWIFANLDTIFTGVSKLIFGSFIMLLALFYFLRDGRELKRQIIAISPLNDADDERIMRKMQQAVYSVFAGSIGVGIIQGILTGIGFALFNVPSPALWGAVAAVAALIPGIGTALVVVPGVLYLFLTGSTGYAIGLLVWGVVAVGLIDNFLGPIFINRGVRIHPFLILISVLGGLFFFGPVGFVLGPIILAFLFALLEIYRITFTRPQA